jgi:hypothetical protein
MLFHSAYSNSYVNLAIFKADVDRARLSELVGEDTEALIHKFCVVPRHELIYEKLLWKLTDDADLDKAPEGIMVKHIKTGGRPCTGAPAVTFQGAPGMPATAPPTAAAYDQSDHIQAALVLMHMPAAARPRTASCSP